MVNLEEITRNTKMLTSDLKRINAWVEQNPNTDPNYYEYADCLVRLGELASDITKYYDQVGWPIVEGETLTHYDAWRSTPELEACSIELKKLANLRGICKEGFSDRKTNPDVYKYLVELNARCVIGEYFTGENPAYRKMKKELICKSLSVPFYIWQVQRTEPDYQYDNREEYEQMKQYHDYNVQLYPEQYSIQYLDGSSYKGPQFGDHIDKMFKRIEASYKYAEAKGDKPTTYVKK